MTGDRCRQVGLARGQAGRDRGRLGHGDRSSHGTASPPSTSGPRSTPAPTACHQAACSSLAWGLAGAGSGPPRPGHRAFPAVRPAARRPLHRRWRRAGTAGWHIGTAAGSWHCSRGGRRRRDRVYMAEDGVPGAGEHPGLAAFAGGVLGDDPEPLPAPRRHAMSSHCSGGARLAWSIIAADNLTGESCDGNDY